MPLSPLAEVLLVTMAREPDRIEYHFRLLGHSFGPDAVDALDRAYEELHGRGLIQNAFAVVSFSGKPKVLFRITPAGKEHAGRLIA